MEIEKKKRQFNPDRIVLNGDSVAFLKQVAAQIESQFGGMIKLNNKELANFILKQRAEPLSAQELGVIKDLHFDDVRAAQWAVKRLKEAKGSGESLSLKDVLGIIQTPQVKKKREPKLKQVKRLGGETAPMALQDSLPVSKAVKPEK